MEAWGLDLACINPPHPPENKRQSADNRRGKGVASSTLPTPSPANGTKGTGWKKWEEREWKGGRKERREMEGMEGTKLKERNRRNGIEMEGMEGTNLNKWEEQSERTTPLPALTMAMASLDM
jgi:hypothetical protein